MRGIISKRSTNFAAILVLAMSIVLLFVACNSGDGNNQKTEEPSHIVITNNSVVSTDRYVTTASTIMMPIKSYTDGSYNYFHFYLGSVENVPISYETPYHYTGINAEFEHSVVEVSQKMISDTSEICIENTTSEKHSVNVDIGGEFDAFNAIEFNVQFGWEGEWANSQSVSTTDTQTTASEWIKEHSTTVRYSFDDSCQEGYYRYTLFGQCDVYVIIAYNLTSGIIYKDYLVCARPESYYYGIDYSATSRFEADENINKLVFDEEMLEDLPLDSELEPYQPNQEPMRIIMARQGIVDQNNYDPDKPETNSTFIGYHQNFELGELVVSGCRMLGNQLVVSNNSDFALRYHLLQNPKDLPDDNSKVTKDICDDSETSVDGTSISGRIGKGAYWVRVTYTDYSQEEYVARNFLANAVKDGYMDLIPSDSLATNKAIAKIEVVVVYEMFTGAPGVLGIWWKDYTNWRCTYTFDFAN